MRIGELFARIPAFFRERRRKRVLNSPEYQFMARDAAEREDREKTEKGEVQRRYDAMVKTLDDNMMTAAPAWQEMPPEERLEKYLNGMRIVTQAEKIEARNARREAKIAREKEQEALKKAEKESERAQRIAQELRTETDKKRLLEAVAGRIPSPIVTVDSRLLVTYFNPAAKDNAHLALGDSYFERSFSTRAGFDEFVTEVQQLSEGQSIEKYVLLGKGEDKGNYMVTVYPILADGAPIGYGMSMREETNKETRKRKGGLIASIFGKKEKAEAEPGALPEPDKA